MNSFASNTEIAYTEYSGLVRSLIRELEAGRKLILTIGDEGYLRSKHETGSIGAHFRHNLDFVEAALKGIESGVVDYAARDRDVLIETSRRYATAKFERATEAVRSLTAEDLGSSVTVVSEIDRSVTHRSTFSRELEFVVSHTVHHHALIKQKLLDFGFGLDENFGVAPSTLEYWKRAAA